MIQELRVNFLEKLSTNVAERIAYKNAQKVLQLKE
jgi:hypothetical protein